MTKVSPHEERIKEIRKIIDALLDIKFALGGKRILSLLIKRSELQVIINDVKERSKDPVIDKELDKLFGEYFSSKDSDVLKTKVDQTIGDEISKLNTELLDNGSQNAPNQQKGNVKVKVSPYFKNKGNSEDNNPANAAN